MKDNPSVQLVVRAVAVAVIVLCTLGTLFSYKFYLIATMTPTQIKMVMETKTVSVKTSTAGGESRTGGALSMKPVSFTAKP